tara:strand:- start:176 stop:604 length:429 start_codon:yes stop_codon:yes gene_type:complete
MGLDMYLKGRRYLWQNADADIATDIQRQIGVKYRVTEVSIEAMYWRKANQIHDWFVQNVQNGMDDCERYFVSRTMLEKLLADCQAALDQKDGTILPPSEGFFFGSTEIDEDYWNDIERTAAGISLALTDLGDDWDFEYRASW